MTVYEYFEKYENEYRIHNISCKLPLIENADINAEDCKKYVLLMNLLMLHEEYKKNTDIFRPYLHLNDGTQSFSLDDMTEDDYNLLAEIDVEKLPLVIRARIYDIQWVTRNDFHSAQKAVEAYQLLFEYTYDNSQWITCIDMIHRAVKISARLGKKKTSYISLCERIIECVVKENGNDQLFLSIELIKLLYDERYGKNDDYLKMIDVIIDNAIKQGHSFNKIESAFDLKRKLLLRESLPTEPCDLALISFYEQIADATQNSLNDAIRAVRFLEKAISVSRKCGNKEKTVALSKKLNDAQKKIPSKMTPISHSIDLTAYHTEIVKLFEGTSFVEDIQTLTNLVHIFKREELEKKVLNSGSVLSGLFGSRYLDKHGHTIIELPPLLGNENNVEILNLHLFRKLSELQNYYGQTCLRWGLQEFNRKHHYDDTDLAFIFDDCAVVRPDRAKILSFGVNLALHGKFYEALHILAPQVEDIFRFLAEETGGLTYYLDNDNTTATKVLTSIFDIPELIDCCDPDYLFTFRGLLNEKAGSNIRNLIAHGILDPDSANVGTTLYFCLAVLKMCSNTSHSFYKKLNEAKEN